MKTVFSGVRPSGVIHLGNYLGAIKNWVELQKNYRCIFCVVDYHAITTPFNPKELSRNTLETAATYLAAGIDPKKSLVFVQSHNPDHTELAWILNTISRNSDLTRMRQFYDKSGITDLDTIKKMTDEDIFDILGKEVLNFSQKPIEENVDKNTLAELKNLSSARQIKVLGHTFTKITVEFLQKFFWTPFNKANVGLFDYPVLMAADILLYGTDIVPVGEDQKQHVELARTLARRFNQQFGETLKVPEVMVRQEGARIMGLDDPTKKMSKSAASPLNYIALTDTPEIIKDKIKKAVTDSGSEVKYDPQSKPAISNLLAIYSLVTDKSIPELEKQYKDCHSYVEFKKDVADAVVESLAPFQKRFNGLIKKPDEIKKILEGGAKEAREISDKTLGEVKKKMGLI